MGVIHRVPLRGGVWKEGLEFLPYPALLAAQLKPDVALYGTQCLVVGIQFLSPALCDELFLSAVGVVEQDNAVRSQA